MATARTNLDVVFAGFDDAINRLDLRKPGIAGEGSAAQDIQQIICDAYIERITAEKDPSGNAWAPNAPEYAARKKGRPVGWGLDRKGHTSGHMKSSTNIYGKLESEGQRITIRHGMDELGKKLLQWFSNGSAPGIGAGECSGAKNQPPRLVVGLDESIHAKVRRYLSEFLATCLQGKGG